MTNEKQIQNQQEGQAQEVVNQQKNLADTVASRIHDLENQGQIKLPQNYSAGNALKSAWLRLQEIKTKDDKPVLQVCSKESIYNALFDMAIQGLQPNKAQGYFIPYGQQLYWQNSAYGWLTTAKRMAAVKDARPLAVFEGDTFKYNIDPKSGRKEVTEHQQELDNLDGEIKGAYCIVEFEDGTTDTEIMTKKQIVQAWEQGIQYKRGKEGNRTQDKFPEEMAKKTIMTRALKRHIRSTSDEHLFIQSMERADEGHAEYKADQEIEVNANTGEVIEADYTVDAETADYQDQQQKGQDQEGAENNKQEQQEQANINDYDEDVGF